MNCKRVIALLLSIATVVALSSCSKGKTDESEGTSNYADSVTQSVSDNVAEETEQTQIVSADNKETKAEESNVNTEAGATDDSVSSTTKKADAEKPKPGKTVKNTESAVKTTQKNSNNPAEWNKEKIAAVYKAAAKKSHSGTKSAHKIEIKKISVNNGEFEGLFDFIMPIMSKLLANNSEDKDGITGGYNNLTASDIASAKAYKSGKNTVIEMTMKEQVSGPKEDANSGSVGHAITAVGDISVVTKQLADLKLPLEISDKDTKIYYTNPTVKVVINEGGRIINGTWKYTVEIRLDNYKAFGKEVETTSVIMDNILTVNGGFKK